MDWTHVLKQRLNGATVLTREDELFSHSASLFNAAIDSPAQCAVLCKDSQQISEVVRFAKDHLLSVSVKGGGYNVAGWSVQGDIIIDLALMDSVQVHLPDSSTGKVNVSNLLEWTPLESAFGTSNSTIRSSDRGTKRGETDAFGIESQSEKKKNRSTAEISNLLPNGNSATRPQHSAAHAETSIARTMTNSSSSSTRDQTSGSGEPSEETSETSHPSREASGSGSNHEETAEGSLDSSRRSSNKKGKAREITHEGTRSWVQEQTLSDEKTQSNESPVTNSGRPLNVRYAPPAIAPYATAFAKVPLPGAPTTERGAQQFASAVNGAQIPANFSVSSDGFNFNPSAIHSSTRPNSAVPPTGSSSSAATTLPSTALTASTANQPFALVSMGAGMKSKQLDEATAAFGYHVPLAAYPVGCAVFASGGYGFLSRLHGLSMDNVVEAEIVLPDGRILHLREPSPTNSECTAAAAAEQSEEDREQNEMWWAFRGAGLALGILTKLRVKAYKVGISGKVYSGNLIFPFNPITAPSLLKHWRDVAKNADRELYMNACLTAGPDDSSHVIVIQLCYTGTRERGDSYLQAILSWEGERCLLKDVEMRSFLTQQESVVQVLSAQQGNRWCIRANLMTSLPDQAIHDTVNSFKNIPERSAWLFELAGGAIGDYSDEFSCFPAGHRSAPFQVAAIHQWQDEADDDTWVLAARRWIDGVIAPHSPGGSYPCFLEHKEGVEKTMKLFGQQNWHKLKALKDKYDPDRLLRHTFWVEEDEPPRLCKADSDVLIKSSAATKI